MSGLRFGMFTTFYPPYSFGGDGIGIQRLARALIGRGHEVTVVHDADAYNALAPRRDPSPGPDDGVRRIPLKSGVGTLSPLLTQQFGWPVLTGARLTGIMEREQFDVIWLHNVSLVGGPGLMALGKAVKLYEAHEHWLVCPTHVLWRHGREVCTGRQCLRCVLHHHRPPQLWRYTGYLQRQLKHVHAFIAKSRFSRDKHREFGFPREMEVVPYFLPDAPTNTREPEGSPHDRPFFLFVGRLERIKGLDDVIPMFRQYPDADLLIAGDGEYGADLRRLAEGVPNVRFLGRVQPEELSRYYHHAIGLIVPSVCYETFGIILIEAFRQGTPVLARKIGPFPEIVERSGGGETFETAEELLPALRRFQHDREYRDARQQAALRSFREYWSEDAVMPQYLNVVRTAALTAGRTSIAEALAEEVVA